MFRKLRKMFRKLRKGLENFDKQLENFEKWLEKCFKLLRITWFNIKGSNQLNKRFEPQILHAPKRFEP